MSPPSSSFTISELAKETRIPIPRIKFYLREGLLPAGNLAAKKRAFYDAQHVNRLRLIHTLRHVAELSLPAIFDLCQLLEDDREADLSSVVLHVIDALARRQPKATTLPVRDLADAHKEVVALLQAHGLRVRANAPSVVELASALAGLRQVLGPEVSAQAFVSYLDAMKVLAKKDFEAIEHLVTDRVSAGIAATFGTVLWEPVLLLLRRITHEHMATERLATAARKRGRR